MESYSLKGTVQLFSDDKLPEGFKYPTAFRKMEGVVNNLEYDPWVFDKPHFMELNGLIGMVRDYLPNAIPFAVDTSFESQGNTACFDGNNTDGNPKVYIVYIDGSRQVIDVGYFEDWLADAKAFAEKYRKRFPELYEDKE